MKPETSAQVAWGTVIAGVTIYDLLCKPGGTMSEGADRAIESHPWLTCAAVGAVAMHLINAIPERIDPIHLAFKALKRGALDCDI